MEDAISRCGFAPSIANFKRSHLTHWKAQFEAPFYNSFEDPFALPHSFNVSRKSAHHWAISTRSA
jgi:hypothetical protein